MGLDQVSLVTECSAGEEPSSQRNDTPMTENEQRRGEAEKEKKKTYEQMHH